MLTNKLNKIEPVLKY